MCAFCFPQAGCIDRFALYYEYCDNTSARRAGVSEQADDGDLKSSGPSARAGSSPAPGTMLISKAFWLEEDTTRD